MFNFKKVIYNNESYKDITLNLNQKGVELIDKQREIRSYIPFYNIYAVEQKKTTTLWLKTIVGLSSLLVSFMILQSLQFTIQMFSDYGVFQFIMLILISLSIGYLFAISLLYIFLKNDLLVYYSIVLKNDTSTIKLAYEDEVKQRQAYEHIKQTIENMDNEDTVSVPFNK